MRLSSDHCFYKDLWASALRYNLGHLGIVFSCQYQSSHHKQDSLITTSKISHFLLQL